MKKFLQGLAYLTRTDRSANRMEYIVGMLAMVGFLQLIKENIHLLPNFEQFVYTMRSGHIFLNLALSFINIIYMLIGLMCAVTFLMIVFALQGRRLRDLGYNPLNSIFLLIPVFNIFMVLYLALFPGNSKK